MAHLEGETSNAIFDALEDWNEQLKHLDLDDDFDWGGPSL